MIAKRVLRYYCEYCHRGLCQKAGMVRHEANCYLNPKRVCRECAADGRRQADPYDLADALPPVEDLTAADAPIDLSELRKVSGDCPSCMLSALRISRCLRFSDFNYAEETGRSTHLPQETNDDVM